MKRFARLYDELDATTSTLDKQRALVRYFADAPEADRGWAVFLLFGSKLKTGVTSRELRDWTRERVAVPEWLFEECYSHVGDLAETMALLLNGATEGSGSDDASLATWMGERVGKLKEMDRADRLERISAWVDGMAGTPLFLFFKLLTGSLRVGVSRGLVEKSLAEWSGVARNEVAHRLTGTWDPTAELSVRLRETVADARISQPYPFCLANALAGDPPGDISRFQIEHKWDGIRAQILKRKGEIFVWSRGEELVSSQFPELLTLFEKLDRDVVVDGEILSTSFATLQKRLGRKKPGEAILKEAPVHFTAYDLLEEAGEDVRAEPLSARRRRLEKIAHANRFLKLSPVLTPATWDEARELRATAREVGAEGLMVKELASPYVVGRRKGAWYKWKSDPFSFDGVLIYAQAGHGRRSGLYTDYTFGVWKEGELVPVAKAYSGLDDAEISKLDNWIRRHTRERFGPVRSVEPTHVFEIAFEGIAASKRHKSGIAVRFPRIARWRTDKPAAEADKIETLWKLIDEK